MLSSTAKYNLALRDFRRARLRATLQEITARLRGHSTALLAYDEVMARLRMTGSAERGVQSIPVKKIVGSVGRYNDFSRTFLPRRDHNRERWAAVRTATERVTDLPPIQVYQVGDAYFVQDGNHRVSIARQQGLEYLDAYVTEVRTRVPLAPDDSPDALIIKAEYAEFLEFTRLDVLRPGANLLTSVPGQTVHLENHIEVFRYFAEEAEGRPLSDEEAVRRWYDEAYLPLVEAVREQGLLRFLPGRTEADFYVWIAAHGAALRRELDWPVSPPKAVLSMVDELQQRGRRPLQRLARSVLNVVRPESAAHDLLEEQWATTRLLARYSDRLFQDILVPIRTPDDDALTQALAAAAQEQARLYGLLLTPAGADDPDQAAQVHQAFEERCRREQVQGYLAVESGPLAAHVSQRALLMDLVVLDRALLTTPDGTFTEDGLALLAVLRRPLLVTSAPSRALRRLLLAYDGGGCAQEGLFIAAYLAEQWGASLVVLTVLGTGRTSAATLDHARRYLALHELEATFVTATVTEPRLAAATISATALAHDADLVIIGSHGEHQPIGRPPGQTAAQLLATWRRPLLVCP